MLKLHKQYARRTLPLSGSSVMHLDLEKTVKRSLPAAEAAMTIGLITRAIQFHSQPS